LGAKTSNILTHELVWIIADDFVVKIAGFELMLIGELASGFDEG